MKLARDPLRDWPARRIESYVAASRGLCALFAEMRAERDAWLAARGYTLQTARQMPKAARAALEAEWRITRATTAIR